MQFVTFIHDATPKVGVMLNGQHVIDLNTGYQKWCQTQGKPQENSLALDMKHLLEQGESVVAHVRELVAFATEQKQQYMREGWICSLEQVQLTIPISNPQKIVAIGQNYRDHCAEHSNENRFDPLSKHSLPPRCLKRT